MSRSWNPLPTCFHCLLPNLFDEVIVGLLFFGEEAEDVDVFGGCTSSHLQGLPRVWGALKRFLSPPPPLLDGFVHFHKHADLPVDKEGQPGQSQVYPKFHKVAVQGMVVGTGIHTCEDRKPRVSRSLPKWLTPCYPSKPQAQCQRRDLGRQPRRTRAPTSEST